MATTILTKRSNTASAVPLAADLTNSSSGAELAVNTADKRLFTKDSGGTVVELGINPSSLTLSGGTANGVLYLNGSKVATSGSALTFDGTTFSNTNAIKSIVEGVNIGNTGSGLVAQRSTNDSQLYIGYRTTPDAWFIGATYASTGAYKPIAFAVNDTEQMRLTSTGLGIGTSSPATKLHVYSTSARPITAGNASATWTFGPTGSSFAFRENSSGSDFLTIDASGNLGLGVTPSAWVGSKSLSLSASGAVYGDGVGYDYTAGISQNAYRANSTQWNYRITGASAARFDLKDNTFAWYNAPSGTAGNAITFTQALTLDASGKFLCGATSGASDRGTFASPQASMNTLGLVSTDDASGGGFILFRNSAFTAIGSVSRVTTTNAVVYNTTSDYRLKTVTGAVSGQGARIDALKPIDYQWKDGGQQARGFLAHEFETVYPNSVTGEKDAVDADGNPVYQAMQASTAEVIADLVAEIQSLRVRVAQLESN